MSSMESFADEILVEVFSEGPEPFVRLAFSEKIDPMGMLRACLQFFRSQYQQISIIVTHKFRNDTFFFF